MTLKQTIYNHYLLGVNDKIKMLQQVLGDLKDSAANETKSTAGDKHETALAMLQIEQRNVGAQLGDVLDKKALLLKINPLVSVQRIVSGSLVKTNRGYFYVSAALGKLTVNDISVTALSTQSPLGMKLMGLSINDNVQINNTNYIIESIM